jgi:hypothetical protein
MGTDGQRDMTKLMVAYLEINELKYTCIQLVKAELSNIRTGGTYGI